MKLNLLLVEDNPGDAHLVRKGLNRLPMGNEVHLVTDGLQAIQFLKKEGIFEKMPRPDLIILDLNLPGKHGHEVLSDIKQNPEWKAIPVIVLSSSSSESDIRKSSMNHANAYLVKPMELADYMHLTDTIGAFWMGLVKLASKP